MNRIGIGFLALAAAAALAENAATNETANVADAANVATNETYVDMITGKPWTPDSKWTIEQLKARDERVLKKTGGFLHVAASGPRALLVVARAKERATIDEVARLYKLGSKLDADTAKEPLGDASPLAAAQAKMAAAKPLLLVMVVDGDAALPALAVFPEERVGIVNAARLQGGEDPSAPEMRVSKEIWRAIGFIGGIGFSAQENDMMQPYYTLEEIDANNHPYIQPMNMAKMAPFWKRFGVAREKKVPYMKAVKEGWAPPPTNDYQRAIWNEARAGGEGEEQMTRGNGE
ncbi:MAG: hypothetical protein IJP66_08600 [Kiritimatiellae bacterium]|nr:hypothetical protein [Kiritimatiellia bacterium]